MKEFKANVQNMQTALLPTCLVGDPDDLYCLSEARHTPRRAWCLCWELSSRQRCVAAVPWYRSHLCSPHISEYPPLLITVQRDPRELVKFMDLSFCFGQLDEIGVALFYEDNMWHSSCCRPMCAKPQAPLLVQHGTRPWHINEVAGHPSWGLMV